MSIKILDRAALSRVKGGIGAKNQIIDNNADNGFRISISTPIEGILNALNHNQGFALSQLSEIETSIAKSLNREIRLC